MIRRSKILSVCFASLGVFVFSQNSLLAQIIPQDAEWGSTTWGRAGSAAASARGLDAFSTNPAGLATNYGFGTFGGNYLNLSEGRSSWGVGLIDGRKTVIGGLRFQWYDQNPVERQSYDLAAVYRTTYGAAGFTLNIHKYSDLPEKNGWKLSQTAGVLIPVFMGFTVGAYGQNFLDKVDSHIEAPFLALGAAYEKSGFVRLSFQADREFDLPDEEWNYSVGGDLIAKEFFVARAGYRFDQTDDKSFWSVGGGLEAPKLQLNGFYMRTTAENPESGWGLDVSFLF